MIVLSLQSQVVYGHVGHQAGDFILQSLGHEVWSVPTAIYSNHLGKARYRGKRRRIAETADLLRGLADLDRFREIDAIHTGYLGSAGIAKLAAATIAKIKTVNPKAIYLCDPVLGDHGALYVTTAIAEAMRRHLLPLADLLTPNATELFYLAGLSPAGRARPATAFARLRRTLPAKAAIIATGIRDPQRPQRIAALGSTSAGALRIEAPYFSELAVSGLGDAFAAFLLGHYLKARDLRAALRRSMRAMTALCRATSRSGRDELDLVGAQAQWRGA